MLCLGRETKKTEQLGEKKFPQWISSLRVSRSTGEIFQPQMLCFFLLSAKTEHLGKKKFPQWISRLKKICPVDLETLRLEIHWGNFLAPDALFRPRD